MPTFDPACLVDAGTKIFEACDVPQSDARIVSESLVESNLLGHDSHGVIRIPSYVARVKEGDIATGVRIAVVSEAPASAVLNGQWGFGQIMARQAMQFAIDKARKQSVAVVTMHQSNHVGRLGEYSAIAAREGMIGIIMTNNHGAGQQVAPWGGRQARMAPTPISICAPFAADEPVLMDITTAVVAEGKVRVARNRGDTLPEGVILDSEGNPTTDPNKLYGPPRGVILPFGGIVGHKGYALGFMIEIMAGILSGASASCADPVRFGNAQFIAAINIESFMPLTEFQHKVQEFIAYAKSSATVPGVEEILFPGEKEHRERRKRLAEGIFVEDETWNQIREIACDLDVRLDI